MSNSNPIIGLFESSESNYSKFKKEFNLICNDFDLEWFPSVLPAVRRIIVIGDIHGDWKMTLDTLKLAKVINSNNKWIGGDTVVVQLGDQIDRCRGHGSSCQKPETTVNDENSDVRILNFFTKLHNQASRKGGAVYSLLGNHELMNVNGDLRYVSYKGLVDFDKDSVLKNGYENRKIDFDKDSVLKNGYENRRIAFEKGGKYANFLGCSRKGVLIIGSNLFVHGGIVPKLANEYKGKKGVEDINKIISRFLWNKLADKDNFSSITGTLDYSPFWNRLLGTLPSNLNMEDHYCKNAIKPVLDIYNVDRIVVGHTPQFMNDKGINSTCNGSVWRADVGLSTAFDRTDPQIRISSTRDNNRNIQVLEILKDGEIINVLK
jgi:hypothetical protein